MGSFQLVTDILHYKKDIKKKEKNVEQYDVNKLKEIVINAKPLFLNKEESSHIKVKGAANFVTEVDTHVQSYMQEHLKVLYPQVQFMSEEKSNDEIDFSKAVWILDPVDGTTNLIHDFHGSSLSLGLAVNRQVIIGIVYNPDTDELFWAKKGEGAYLETLHDGKVTKLSVSEIDEMGEALVGMGSSPYKKHWAKLIFEINAKIFEEVADFRRIGSAAIEMAYVAAGRMEVFYEAELNPWDYAAGKLLIEEAGGLVTTYDGEVPDISKKLSIVASNGPIGKILVEKYLPAEEEFTKIGSQAGA